MLPTLPRGHNRRVMEHIAPKIGTALAAAALGLGLPATASAQSYPWTSPEPDMSVTASMIAEDETSPEFTAVNDAVASMSDRTQALVNLGQVSADHIVVVSLADMGLTADQRYTLMQRIDPSDAANLQQTLGNVQVTERGQLPG